MGNVPDGQELAQETGYNSPQKTVRYSFRLSIERLNPSLRANVQAAVEAEFATAESEATPIGVPASRGEARQSGAVGFHITLAMPVQALAPEDGNSLSYAGAVDLPIGGAAAAEYADYAGVADAQVIGRWIDRLARAIFRANRGACNLVMSLQPLYLTSSGLPPEMFVRGLSDYDRLVPDCTPPPHPLLQRVLTFLHLRH